MKGPKPCGRVRLLRAPGIRTRKSGLTRTKRTESNKEQRQQWEGIRDPWATWVICAREKHTNGFLEHSNVFFSFKYKISVINYSSSFFRFQALGHLKCHGFLFVSQTKKQLKRGWRVKKQKTKPERPWTVPFQYQTYGTQFRFKEREWKIEPSKRAMSTAQAFSV